MANIRVKCGICGAMLVLRSKVEHRGFYHCNLWQDRGKCEYIKGLSREKNDKKSEKPEDFEVIDNSPKIEDFEVTP